MGTVTCDRWRRPGVADEETMRTRRRRWGGSSTWCTLSSTTVSILARDHQAAGASTGEPRHRVSATCGASRPPPAPSAPWRSDLPPVPPPPSPPALPRATARGERRGQRSPPTRPPCQPRPAGSAHRQLGSVPTVDPLRRGNLRKRRRPLPQRWSDMSP